MTQRTRARGRDGGGLLSVLSIALALGACQSEGKSAPASTPRANTSADPAIAATLPEGPSLSVAAAANDADRSFPLDATPSPDGKDLYYTALSNDADGNRVASVFHTAAKGGAVTSLASGAPLSAPVGIATSADGATLFIADPGADGGGGILTVPASGGSAAALMGTTGYRPQGVTVATVKQRPALYFTGVDPASGDAGLFSVDPAGGTVAAVATGEPFGQPGGVTVSTSGDAYVADALASTGVSGIIRVSGGVAKVFVDRIGVGFPAGVTLTHDDSTLAVSGLDPATRSDVVYFVDLASRELSVLTDTIGAFHDAAGLHRAYDTDVFAWADSRANETGTVFVLRR